MSFPYSKTVSIINLYILQIFLCGLHTIFKLNSYIDINFLFLYGIYFFIQTITNSLKYLHKQIWCLL